MGGTRPVSLSAVSLVSTDSSFPATRIFSSLLQKVIDDALKERTVSVEGSVGGLEGTDDRVTVDRALTAGIATDTTNMTNPHSGIVPTTVFPMYVGNFSSLIMTVESVVHECRQRPFSELAPLEQITVCEDLHKLLREAPLGCAGRLHKLYHGFRKVSANVSDILGADSEYGSTCSIFSSGFIEKVTQCLLCMPQSEDAKVLHHGDLGTFMRGVPRLPDFAADQLKEDQLLNGFDHPSLRKGADFLMYITELQHGNDCIIQRFCDTLLGNDKKNIPRDVEALNNLANAVEYLRKKLTTAGG